MVHALMRFKSKQRNYSQTNILTIFSVTTLQIWASGGHYTLTIGIETFYFLIANQILIKFKEFHRYSHHRLGAIKESLGGGTPPVKIGLI